MLKRKNTQNRLFRNPIFPNISLALAVASIIYGCSKDPLSAGAEHMSKGDFTSATIEFKNAVQASPESLQARISLADALERSYDSIGAEQNLRKALERGGDEDILVPRIALLVLDRGEPKKVLHEFAGRQLKSPEANSNLNGILAMSHIALKQFPLAEKEQKSATVQTVSVKLAKGQLLLIQGKPDEALTELNSALALANPESNLNWWTLRALGRTYDATRNYGQALAAFKRAYELAPWHVGLIGEYGDSLVRANNFADASKLRDKLKKVAPNHYWTHFLDAVLLAEKDQIEASQAAALKVIAVAPEHLRANLLIASAELQTNNAMMAEERLRRIAKQNPYSLQLFQLLATAQLRIGKYEDGNSTIARGLKLVPNDHRLLSLKADMELIRKNSKVAKATLEELIANNPEDATSYLRLSELHMREGRRSEALNYLEKAFSFGKDDLELRDRIIASALLSGNADLAKKLAEHAISSRPKDPASHLALTATLAAQNDIAGAWRATLTALDLAPDYQPALNALGTLAKDTEQRRELRSRYEKALAGKVRFVDTYFGYVRLLRADNLGPIEIIPVLENAVKAFPTNTITRSALIEENLASGNQNAALNIAQTGASAANAPPAATALLAATYERMEKPELAIENYRKLAKDYPQRADWRLKLAELEVRANRKTEAVSLLRALMTDHPFDPRAYIALAKLTARENLSEAVSIAQQLAQKEAMKKTALLLEGDLLVIANKPDDALKQFGKAAKAGAMPEAGISTIQILDRTNRSQIADQELNDLLSKYPNQASVLSFAAQRLLAQGKLEKSIVLFQKAADLNKLNPNALNELAWAQIIAKQPEALGNASKAASLSPNQPDILDTLGLAQLLAGNSKEAATTLRHAVNLAPQVPAHRLHLVQALVETGDKKAAATELSQINSKELGKAEQEKLSNLRTTLAK